MVTDNISDRCLDDETAAFLEQFSNLMATLAPLPIPEQRQKIKDMFLPPKDELEPIEKEEDLIIEGTHGPISLRILTPPHSRKRPTIVFLHRGGWVYGSIDESEGLCRRIANLTHCRIVLVEYSLSPEAKFPVPLDDCYDTVKWVAQDLAKTDEHSQDIVVMGESAGGNLAAAVALKDAQAAHSVVSAQVLIYPCLSSNLILKRFEESPDKHLLSYANMQWFWEQYLETEEDGDQELASPPLAKEVGGLPPTLILGAEYDALCADGQEYGERLQESGVETTIKCYPKVIHGFLDLPLPTPQIQIALDDIHTFLHRFF